MDKKFEELITILLEIRPSIHLSIINKKKMYNQKKSEVRIGDPV